MEHANLCPLCVEPRWHGCKHPGCPSRVEAQPIVGKLSDFLPTAPSLVRQGDAKPTAASIQPPYPHQNGANLQTSTDTLSATEDRS